MKKFKLDRKRVLKLKFRRHLRLQKKQVEELSAQAEQRLENDFFKRLERLGVVRRFVISWMLLIVLLIGCVVAQTRGLNGLYQVLVPTAGGTYTEGVLGSFTNANPIYATDLADTTVSELVFAGLLTYDQRNQLVGDLADDMRIDEAGTTYTLHLRPNLTWHDGQPITADDVVFTFQVIQNPDAQSPLFNSWKGITITAVDPQTVSFTLPSQLASFPYSLTTGIVPRHILGSQPMSDLRSNSFNSTRPIGAGPFKWRAIELTSGTADRRQETIALTAFDRYYGGKPKLNSFVVKTFRTSEQLIDSFKAKELTAITGLSELPPELKNDGSVRVYNLPLTAAVMTFFRTQKGVTADMLVRQALVRATNVEAITSSLPYATTPVREPLLRGQLAYDPRFQQAGFDLSFAQKILDEQGWKVGPDGVRMKGEQPLRFSLYFLNSSEYTMVANKLSEQWRALGADVQLMPQGESDFRSILSKAPAPDSPQNDSYDVLLYGISVGVDPDVYVYWHSSQIDVRSPVRLNFSEYKSAAADAGLEAGRGRLDPALRAAKYVPFLQSWQNDAPALGLYQPRFLYLTHGQVHGLNEMAINTDAGRYKNVHNWQIRERWETPTP